MLTPNFLTTAHYSQTLFSFHLGGTRYTSPPQKLRNLWNSRLALYSSEGSYAVVALRTCKTYLIVSAAINQPTSQKYHSKQLQGKALKSFPSRTRDNACQTFRGRTRLARTPNQTGMAQQSNEGLVYISTAREHSNADCSVGALLGCTRNLHPDWACNGTYSGIDVEGLYVRQESCPTCLRRNHNKRQLHNVKHL